MHLFSVGLYGAEHMKDLRAAAALRRSNTLELMSHGSPRVAADLSTVRVWQRVAFLRPLGKELCANGVAVATFAVCA
eukprot:3254315-Amphidinium_carterae.3